jgi:hypothetical protein
MEGTQTCTPACRGATPPPSIKFQGESAHLTCLKVSEDQSADIDIVTAEGDKVTLSSDQHAEATFLTYEHLVYANSGYEEEEGQFVDYSAERNIALSVEGELNEAELADIRALLADLGQLLKDFLTGKSGGSLEETSTDRHRYSSLSAFEADFEYHANMEYLDLEANQLADETAGRPKLSEATPARQPEVSIVPVAADSPQAGAPAAAAAVSTPKQQVAPAVPLEATPKAVASETDETAREMARKLKESGFRPRRLMKLLKKFLRGLMKEMLANHVIDGAQAKRGENILEKFFGQLEKPSAASEATATNVSVKQQWVSLQYEMKAEVQMQPSVEETV